MAVQSCRCLTKHNRSLADWGCHAPSQRGHTPEFGVTDIRRWCSALHVCKDLIAIAHSAIGTGQTDRHTDKVHVDVDARWNGGQWTIQGSRPVGLWPIRFAYNAAMKCIRTLARPYGWDNRRRPFHFMWTCHHRSQPWTNDATLFAGMSRAQDRAS